MSDDPESRIGSRHESRENVLAILYEAETRSEGPAATLANQALPVDEFTGDLVRGIDEHRDELDQLIGRYAKGWSTTRMPVIDASVLRLAVYELCHRPDVPATAVIAEAVELASEYSTTKSAPFINGVLVAVAEEVRGRGA